MRVRTPSFLSALASLAAAALPAGPAHASTQPAPGNYVLTSYVTAADPACVIPKGTYLSGVYNYPGPGKTGAAARVFINAPGVNSIELFGYIPATPPAGATTWSGQYVQTFLPGGAAVIGTFSYTIQYIDSRSFVDTATYKTVVNNVTCNTQAQESHVLVKP